MKYISLLRNASLKYYIMAVACFLIMFQSDAQNASYNANTIPIGGSVSAAFGWDALKVNTGQANTGIGYQALEFNTDGYSNTAIGFQALRFNTSGYFNTANGRRSLYFNTSGFNNTANGFEALRLNTSGSNNTANGFQALRSNTTGINNTASGRSALAANKTGVGNTATGVDALRFSTTGIYNTGNGRSSLYSNITGNSNTASGFQALFYNTEGNYNVAIGDSAGYSSLGNNNIYIGHQAGAKEIGSDKFYLGNYATNTLIYGDMSTRQILLGNPNPTGYIFKGTRTLNVLGGLLADSIRVALSAEWADYVFDDNYQLKPLEEVSQFIKTNKHLPGIPTASEVKANGIELGEMNAKLLAKIEELTLYLVQQQEQMKAQQQQIDELRKAGKRR